MISNVEQSPADWNCSKTKMMMMRSKKKAADKTLW